MFCSQCVGKLKSLFILATFVQSISSWYQLDIVWASA